MKNIFLYLIFVLALTSACCSKKTNEMKSDTKIAFYDVTWELEYITGPRITFEGLYPEEKPTLIFTENESRFGGNSSCNAYGGNFTKKENSIHFGDAIKTMRFCEGGGEETFLNMLGKINKFNLDNNGKLILLKDDVPMMRFKKAPKLQP